MTDDAPPLPGVVQLPVQAVVRQQIGVGAAFDDPAVIDDEDPVGRRIVESR